MEVTDKTREGTLGLSKMSSVLLAELWQCGMLDMNGRVWMYPIPHAMQGSSGRGGTPRHCEWLSSSLLNG